MKKPILAITGLNSLLGSYLAHALHSRFTLFGFTHNTPVDSSILVPKSNVINIDITQKKRLTRVLSRIRPDVVIHLAALSNIDYCQTHPQEAYKINVEGTKYICEALQGKNTHLIFISSNAVFDGTHPPYHENNITRPLNVYGQTKREAEKLVAAAQFPSTIIRSTTMFGWQPKGARANDMTNYISKIRIHNPIFLVNDRFFNPISVKTSVTAIQQIIENNISGTFHIAGKDRVSRYDFVKTLFAAFGIKTHSPIHEVPNTYFVNLAPRPRDATLSIEKMKLILAINPPSLFDELRSFKSTLSTSQYFKNE